MAFICKQAFMTLASYQFDDLVSFYQSLFDQSPYPYRPQRYAEFQLPGLKLGIFKPNPDHRSEFLAKTSGSSSLCLEVDDLVVAIATLTDIGYPPPGNIIQASHGKEIYAYDPAGNRIILHEAN